MYRIFFCQFQQEKSMVKVLFFAKSKEITKISEGQLTFTNSTIKIRQIYQALESQWPDLKKLKRSFALALNEEYLDTNQNSVISVQESDTLAVIPPISGG